MSMTSISKSLWSNFSPFVISRPTQKNLFNQVYDSLPMDEEEKNGETHISEVLSGEKVGRTVKLRGWIHRIRWSKNITFIVLRDSSGTIQCTVKKNSPDFDESKELTIESCISLTGEVREDDRAPGGYEISVDSIKVIGKAEPFPINEEQSTPLILDNSHLWVRSQEMKNVLKVNDTLMNGLVKFFRERDFFKVDPPILITAACEGGSTLFSFDYFGRKAYLTQSSQLYLEAFMASLEKVYCLAPSFRAEKSRTRRHLTEFWHLEAEEAFCDLECTMVTQEEMIEFLAHYLVNKRGPELRELGRDPSDLEEIQAPFDRMTYQEAVEIVQSKGIDMQYGDDFGVPEEKALIAEYDQPFFVHNFARSAKGFYHRPDPQHPDQVLCADLLAPEGNGEIIGGGERIYEPDILIERIEEVDLDPDDYEWYLDLRKYGTCPHAGFGLGLARLVKWFCDLDHIREAVPFPRTINRIYP